MVSENHKRLYNFMYLAARMGAVNIVKFLVKEFGLHINYYVTDDPILMHVLRHSRDNYMIVDSIKEYINLGANVNACNKNTGYSIYSVINMQTPKTKEILEVLKKHGVLPPSPGSHLNFKSEKNNFSGPSNNDQLIDSLDKLSELGWDINSQDHNGKTYLMGNIDLNLRDFNVVYKKYKETIDYSLVDSNKLDLLMHFVKRYNIRYNLTTFSEIASRSNLNHTDSKGNTIFCYIHNSCNKCIHYADALLKHGADPYFKNHEGVSYVDFIKNTKWNT